MENKKISLSRFFILAFLLIIPFWILNALKPVQILPGIPLSAIGAFIPALAGFILVSLYSGRSGAIQLLRRSFDFRRIKDKKWYIPVVLINPVIALIAYAIIRLGGTTIPNPGSIIITIVPLFIVFFIAALGEEIGWSGYATEPMLRRWGACITAILLGLVWVAYHVVPLLQVNRSVGWIAWWSLDTLALRIIMVWLFIHTGKSVFAAAVFHAMINLSWQLFPVNGSYYDPRIFGLVTFFIALIILLVGLLPADRKRNPVV